MIFLFVRWKSLAGCLLIGSLLSACSPFPQQPHSNHNGSISSQQNYADPRRVSIHQLAHQQLGVRYKWGGTSPRTGFDCSGYTQYVYAKSGVNIPRTAAQQRDASQGISRSQLQLGDLIFFKTGARSHHVGIYIGRGEFIQAGSGSGRVKIERLDNPYWKKRWVKYGTYLI
ncbi:MAG TPA: NlpC/P60 family protein [Thiothrix sp.]|nr:NlpC/P60 family protein [Thiothrix sp.]